MTYRSIFISDIHLGSRNSNIEKLLNFLKNNECDNLFIVGDFIDGWELKYKWKWDDNYNVLIQKLLRKSRKNTKIYIIIGNHDDFLFEFENMEFGNIHILREYIHTTKTNKKCLVLHGDQYDGIMKYAQWLQHIGSHVYNFIIDVNSIVNKLLNKFGKHFSLSKFIKKNTKTALNFIKNFEECAILDAKSKECDVIVTGHIHVATHQTIDGIDYFNCGSFQEDECHAIIETIDGSLALIEIH